VRPPRKGFGDTKDPAGLPAMVLAFLDSLRVRGYSEETAKTWGKQLRPFVEWLADRSIARPNEVTRQLLERYQRNLHLHRKANGEPLSAASQNARLTAIRRFFAWLTKQNHILWNPASELERVRVGRQLPRNVLTPEEAEKVLAMPNVEDAIGVRDRAILETLYSTGVRRAELAHLNVHDLDRSRGVVMVRLGKGAKDRVVPIGERAVAWIEKYIAEARPKLVRRAEDEMLFVSRQGGRIGLSALSHLVGGYVIAAGIAKEGACHLFRHTMATLMLENGADLRVIQEILGHATLGTTQVYTHLSIGRLKQVHAATHPAANLGAKPQSVQEGAQEALDAILEADEEDDGDS
jgi:integrase/recombinase XerD